MSDDLWWPLHSESIEADPGAGLPFVVPPPPESFEEVFEGLDLDDLDNFDKDVQFPSILDSYLPISRDASTPSLTSSASTYSTDLTEDTTNSEYSSMTHSTSSYPSPFDIIKGDLDFGPEFNGVDSKHIPEFSDPSLFFDSLGSLQFAPEFFQRVDVVNAQLDDGPYRPSVGISPHILSAAAFPGPPPAVPTGSPVGVGSSPQIHTGPMRTKFMCTHCGHRTYSLFFFFFSLLNFYF